MFADQLFSVLGVLGMTFLERGDLRLELATRIFGTYSGAFFERRASYPWMVVGTVCIGTFIGQIDASIIQLAMPSLEDAFDAPLHAVSWAAVGYVLAFASALPLFARLAEIGGRKALYLTGFVLLEGGTRCPFCKRRD
ncbi:MAG: MFS transporter [Xanthobacteraceae bacterium]